jgi:hypothetical protein
MSTMQTDLTAGVAIAKPPLVRSRTGIDLPFPDALESAIATGAGGSPDSLWRQFEEISHAGR